MSSYIDQLVEQLMLPNTSNSISYINSFQLKISFSAILPNKPYVKLMYKHWDKIKT